MKFYTKLAPRTGSKHKIDSEGAAVCSIGLTSRLLCINLWINVMLFLRHLHIVPKVGAVRYVTPRVVWQTFNERLGRNWNFHLLPWRSTRNIPPKRFTTSNNQHGVTCQNGITLFLESHRISHMTTQTIHQQFQWWGACWSVVNIITIQICYRFVIIKII